MNEIYIASAMIIDNNNELLMVRKKGSLFYQLAGGKIEKGEEPNKTLERELLEELDLDLSDIIIAFLGTHATQAVNEKKTMVHGTIFKIMLPYKLSFQPQAELEEIVWINKNNYKQYKYARLAEEFILPIWLNP